MVKNPPAHAGDTNLIPALGRSPGEGNGNPLQYSCLGNHMDRGLVGLQPMVSLKSQTWLSQTSSKDQIHFCQKFLGDFQKELFNFSSCCLVTKSCPTLWDPMDCSPTRLFCPWDFPGKDTRVGCHLLLQGIFPTQGLNWRLLHWQADSLLLSH